MSDTTERLREDIDRGRTGDKVAGQDPAAVPLGADDEAGGRPPTPITVAQARAGEVSRPSQPRERPGVGHAPGLGHAWILVLFALLLGTAIVLWTALTRGNPSAASSAPVIAEQ